MFDVFATNFCETYITFRGGSESGLGSCAPLWEGRWGGGSPQGGGGGIVRNTIEGVVKARSDTIWDNCCTKFEHCSGTCSGTPGPLGSGCTDIAKTWADGWGGFGALPHSPPPPLPPPPPSPPPHPPQKYRTSSGSQGCGGLF
jgi:hypothetical protein